MTASAKLKAKLLDLAIRGKLVAQNPNDESAEMLLAKIHDVKERLVKAKKIKKEKPLPPVTDDEKPFELPNGWAWCRLGELGFFTGGKTPSTSVQEFWGGDVLWVTSKDMKSKYITDSILKLTKLGASELSVVDADSILMCMRSGILQRIFPVAIAKEALTINQDQRALTLHLPEMAEYIYDVLKSMDIKILADCKKEGTTVASIDGNKLATLPIPLPPLAEQKRIVTRLEELLKAANTLEECAEKFDALNDKARAKILDLAIRGKLCTQDPNDEPADALLARIRDEKAKLVKAKKTKKGKPLPPITEDETPFDLPNGWAWCRLGEVCNYGECQSENVVPENAWVLDLEDIEKGTGNLLARVVSQERQSTSAKHVFKKGMLLYSKLRTYLNKVLVADKDGYCTSEILPLDFGDVVDVWYARMVLMSPYFLDYAASCCYGVKMPRLGTDDGRKALFPLPPLEEQKRIVAKVEAMLSACEKLKGAGA